MALRLKNRVKETTTTTGTGTITVSGTAPTGFQTFASALADGDTTYYQITDGTDWEIGLGTWNETAGTIARTTIFESSNSNSAVSWGAGTRDVFIVMPAEKVSGTTSYSATSDMPLTANQIGDQAFVTANNNLYIWNGSGWFKIATVNQTPTISGNSASYTLATDGTATVVTMSGTDPEGFPLTWSATESGDTGIATTTNSSNVFTITPVTSGSGGTMTVTFSASDGVNTATANSTFSLSFTSALWPDVSMSLATGATNGDDNATFIDRSSNSQTVTTTGDPAQTGFNPYLDNWSVNFDGTNDYLEIAASNDHDFDGDFTVEAWIYRTGSTTGTYQAIFGGNGSSVNGWNWYLNQSDGQLLWFYSTIPTQNATYVELNQWTHIAACRSGTNLYLFKNGSLYDTLTGYTGTLTNASTLRIGYDIGANGYWEGYISNVRVVKGTAVYTSAFTPSTEKLTAVTNTVLLTCHTNRFLDDSSSGHTLTPNGNLKVEAFNPFGQLSDYDITANEGSVYLDTGDEVVIAHDASLSAGTGDFCLQFWVYADVADNSSYKGLVAKYSGGAGGIWIQPLNGVLQVGFSTSVLGTGTKNVMDNQWHHIAFTRSGTACKVFVDGEQEISFTSSDNLNNTVDFLIGDMGTLSRNFKGYVSDLKYDVGNAVYTSAFTPPTSPVGTTNADLYLSMDNAAVFDITGNTSAIVPTEAANGSPTLSTAVKKYESASINFGTISDDKLFQINGCPPLGNGPFTIEGWIYPTNVAGTWQSILTRDYGGTGGWRLYKQTGTGKLYWYRGSTATLLAGDAMSDNTWYHFAVTRDASDNLRMFLDGTQTGSTTANTYNYTAADPDNPLNIGSGGQGDASAYPFAGYLEGVQVLVGVAKYTANFTAPTGVQGRNYQAED